MSLHYNGGNSCLFADGKEIYKFKANNKKGNFFPPFYLGSLFNKWHATDAFDQTKKKMCMIFQLITILLIDMIF